MGFRCLFFFAFVPLLFAEFRLRDAKSKHIKLKVLGLAYISFFLWEPHHNLLAVLLHPVWGCICHSGEFIAHGAPFSAVPCCG